MSVWLKSSVKNLMYPEYSSDFGAIPVGKTCFVEYFARSKPCRRVASHQDGAEKCYAINLTPDSYAVPSIVPKGVIPSQFVGQISEAKETKDSFNFDYSRGQILPGTFSTYDLSKGYFTCLHP